MAKTNPIRIGLAGIGRAGWGMHAAELAGKPDLFQFTAGCDLLPDRRAMFARKYNCPVYERIEDMARDPNVELVSIATYSRDHFAHAALALKAGKHVSLEKPMTLSLAEAKKLAALAEKSKGHLFIRHNRRYEPAFVHVSEIIATGVLGDIYEIKLRRLRFGRRDDWQTLRKFGGGQLTNWGPHLIDHALCFLGAPLQSVWTDLRRIAAAGDAEDHVKLLLRGENGRVVDVEISGGAALEEPEYHVMGTRGALICDGRNITLKHLDPRKKMPSSEAGEQPPPLDNALWRPAPLRWVEKTFPVSPKAPAGMDRLWVELHAALRRNKPYPIPMEHALEVMRVISLAKKQAILQ